MPNYNSKGEILTELETEYQKLEKAITGLTPGQMITHGACGKWSVKDLLAHLTEWGTMFMSWYSEGLTGRVPHAPSEGFTWRELPALNKQIYERHKDYVLEIVISEFKDMHRKFMQLAKDIPESDYFVPGLYTWMGRSRMALFIHANGGGHYKWARQWIVKWKKQKGIAS